MLSSFRSLPISFSLFVLVAIFLLTACDDQEVLPPTDLTTDYSYFPLELNQPKFYALDSIVVIRTTRGAIYDTARLEVRETLVEQFTAPDGMETFRGERWDRRLPSGDWRFRQTYTVSRTATTALRSEDNLTFTKLVFPIRTGKDWDGHTAFDDFDPTFFIGGEPIKVYKGWEYQYQRNDEGIADGAAGLNYEDAILVQQDSTSGLIETAVAYEIYAPGIGRVERYVDVRRTQCEDCCNRMTEDGVCLNLPWSEKAEAGFVLRETFLR